MSTPGPALADPRKSHAVLIGVSAYTSMAKLPAVEGNLRSFRELLLDPKVWGLPEQNIHVIKNPGNRDEILEVIHRSAAQTTGTLLIYYAGHGIRAEAGDLRLVMVGGSQKIAYRTMRFEDIREELLAAHGMNKVVILDCCYSGAADMGEESIADFTTVAGTYVMTATSARRRALAPAGHEYTLFTGTLLKAIRDGIPDGPPVLSMDTLFHKVETTLRANDQPLPEQRSLADGHHIAIARNQWGLPQSSPVAGGAVRRMRRRVAFGVAGLLTLGIGALGLSQPWHSDAKPGPAPSSSPLEDARAGLASKSLAERRNAVAVLGRLAQSSPTDRAAACGMLQGYVSGLLPFPRVSPYYDQKMPALSYRAADAQDAITMFGAVPCLRVKLEERDLRVVRFTGDFHEAQLSWSSLFNSDLRGAKFDGATLTGTHLEFIKAGGVSFVNANFDGAEVADANLIGADLRGASFKVLSDRRALFWRTKLGGADLRGAHLEGADFRLATFDTKTRLAGATADKETIWPPNFDPRAAGVIF